MSRLITAVATIVATTGCTRYTYSDPSCPQDPARREAWRVTTAPQAPGRIQGVVVDADSRRAVGEALLFVLPGSQVIRSDTLGAFRSDSLPAGSYSLLVRRIGYRNRRVDSVHVDDTAGADLRVSLETQALDECPGFMVVVTKKPWWQWW